MARVIDLILEGAPMIILGLLTYAYVDIEAEVASIDPAVLKRASLLVGLMASALIVHIVQWVLIASHGQTVGKKVMGLRIVDEKTHEHPGAVRALILRSWFNALMLGNIFYFLADSLLIFRAERKCLHDFVARTVVITV